MTKRLAPGLCALAIVSDSLAVRTAASGLSIADTMRGATLTVKALQLNELADARTWCAHPRTPAPS